MNGVGRDIFKDPKTDDGTKKSAKGLMQVYRSPATGKLALKDQCTWEEEGQGELKTVFKNGKLMVDWTLGQIRQRLRENL